MSDEDKSLLIDDSISKMLDKKHGAKKRTNSIRKGKSFERTIAKLLTDTLGIEIARVPQSGAFSTVHESETFSGDLMAVHKNDYMPFAIECKAYKEINLLDVLNENKKTNIIFEWIRQSEEEGRICKKIPYIIFKLNNSQFYCLSQNFNFNQPTSSNPGSREYLIKKDLIMMFRHKGKWYTITPLSNFKMREYYDWLKKAEVNGTSSI